MSTHSPADVTAKPGRIVSLDVIRGLFLCISVMSASVLEPRPPWLEHATWTGVTFDDLIFPLFVTLSGCGLAFAYRNAVGWRATARRSVVLLTCGLVFQVIAEQPHNLDEIRLAGPLQVYAALVLVIGLLHLALRGPRAWMIWTLALTAAQTAFLYLWQQTCPGNELTRGCNPSGVIDKAWMGASHMYAHGLLGHDPEGLPSILGALVTCSAGTTAGHLALSARGSWKAPAKMLGWAAILAGSAWITAGFVPAMKRLWTTPFALGVASLAVIVLALGMALLDISSKGRSRARDTWMRTRSTIAWPLIALGRNSLLVYFGSHLLVILLMRAGGTPSTADRLADTFDVLGGHSQLSFAIVMLLGWMALAAVLHRRRIYLRP